MSGFATNVSALRANNAMSDASRNVDDSAVQLATGRRINSAADDTAGMAINSKLSAESISLQRAMRNANEGVNFLQAADGVAGNISAALIRMREIAIQSATGSNSDDDRAALDNEFSELRAHLSTSIDSTSWNGQKMLNGTMSNLNLQIGASSSDSQSVEMADFRDLSALSAAGVSNAGDALASLSIIDESLTTIDSARVKWGAAMNRLVQAGDASSNLSINLDSSRSKIMDTDYAQATADLAKAQILQMAGKAMLSQANQAPISVLRLLR